MKFSEQWLRQWVDPALDPKALCAQLTMAGLEVDSIEAIAAVDSNIVIGKIAAVDAKSDDGQTVLLTVDIGQEQAISCPVTEHQFAPLQKIAVDKTGRVYTEAELQLSERHDILFLHPDAPEGEPLTDYLQLGDNAIDIDLTPNRGDCLSIAGLAREVAALNGIAYHAQNIKPLTPLIDDSLTINIEAKDDCPRYVGVLITNIDAKKASPDWLKERLRRAGIRSIDAVVDVTNYVMLELGQPMHAFDANCIDGGIVVRHAVENESITLLDGKTVTVAAGDLLIADHKKPLALAGVMGGFDSRVTENSNAIFLESAFFAPHLIAGRARRYGLHTDSAHRFERGVDPELAKKAIERASELLLEIVGGKVGPVVESVATLPHRAEITLRPERVNRLLGVEFELTTISELLQRLGMTVAQKASRLEILAPSYRFDIKNEADLIEEVARLHGYDAIPSKLPCRTVAVDTPSQSLVSVDHLADCLVSRDYREAITYSFTDPKLTKQLGLANPDIQLLNPISQELAEMRRSLWPGLLLALRHNQNRQQGRVRLFETGLRFEKTADGIVQRPVIAGLAYGPVWPEQWHYPKQTPVDFFDVKADVMALFSLSRQENNIDFQPVNHDCLQNGQAAALYQAGQQVGLMGRLHPDVAANIDVQGPVILFELNLDALSRGELPQYQAVTKFPLNRRDLSFLITENVTFSELASTINKVGSELIQEVVLFDVYQGKGVAAGMKSMAIGLMLQNKQKTLNESEINTIVDDVVAALQKTYAITLRD